MCNGAAGYPQACLNYQSIQANYPEYHSITCPFQKAAVINQVRTIIKKFDDERKTKLWDPLMPVVGGCSPDEYPPAVMADLNDGYDNVLRAVETASFTHRVFHDRGQMVRYLPAVQNEDAGRALFKVCSKAPTWDTIQLSTSRETNRRARRDNVTIWSFYKKIFTRSAYTMTFEGINGYADDGIGVNPCAPTTPDGVRHSGYALLNEDAWFNNPANVAEKNYQPQYLKGPTGAARSGWVEPVGLVVVETNSSRTATSDEIRDEFGFDDCADDKCTREIAALRAIIKAETAEAATLTASLSEVPRIDAVSTPAAVPTGQGDEATSATVNQPGSDFVQPEWPRQTDGKPEAGSPA